MLNFKHLIYSLFEALYLGLLGSIVGCVFSISASHGLEFALDRSGTENWGIIFWGNHWATRCVVSLVSTYIGAFVSGVGCRSNKYTLCGIISAIPTFVLFASAFVLAVASGGASVLNAHGNWILVVTLVLFSLPIGVYGAKRGLRWRSEHSEWYGLRRRPLGIHWSSFFWVLIPLYLVNMEIWYTSYYAVIVFFVSSLNISTIIGRLLVIISSIGFCFVGVKIILLLTSGHLFERNTWKRARCVLFYTFIMPVIFNLVRGVGFKLLSINNSWFKTL